MPKYPRYVTRSIDANRHQRRAYLAICRKARFTISTPWAKVKDIIDAEYRG